MSERIAKLQEQLTEPLLVTNLINILYLTGLDSSNAALYVTPDNGATLYTDFRYIQTAQEVADCEVVMAERSLLVDLAGRLDGTVAFEADVLPYAQYEVLKAGGLKLVPCKNLVEPLRAVKGDDEIEAVRKTALLADRAFDALTAETWIGATERDVAAKLRELLYAHGADGLSFDSAVASGANGAKPHVAPSDEIIATGTLVVVDWGARAGGYCSDCTRTLATGPLDPELRRAYDVCLEAQLAAIDGIRPGMTGAEADQIARDVIEAAGFGEQFGHGLGHGVGVEIHEAPRLARESTDVLEVGNVVTIEPGIYLPGVGGVRIEDLAVVREDGVELLTSFPKELITLS